MLYNNIVIFSNFVNKKSAQDPQNFKPHRNYQPYDICLSVKIHLYPNLQITTIVVSVFSSFHLVSSCDDST